MNEGEKRKRDRLSRHFRPNEIAESFESRPDIFLPSHNTLPFMVGMSEGELHDKISVIVSAHNDTNLGTLN